MDGLRARAIRWKPNATNADKLEANREIRKRGWSRMKVVDPYRRSDDVWLLAHDGLPKGVENISRWLGQYLPWWVELTQ